MTDPAILPGSASIMRRDNWRMVGKLSVVVTLMFAFGYALVPIYKSICTALGINVLSLAELDVQGGKKAGDGKRARRSTRAARSRSSSTRIRAAPGNSSPRSVPSMSIRVSSPQ